MLDPRNSIQLGRFGNWVEPKQFTFASGKTVVIDTCTLRFKKWEGEPIFNNYGGKGVVDWEGEPTFAELAVVRLIGHAGFGGVWVDTFHRKFHQSMSAFLTALGKEAKARLDAQEGDVPEHLREMYTRIVSANAGRSGFWDVMARKSDNYVFIELKRNSNAYKDRFQKSEKRWLEAAMGIATQFLSFVVCEWDFE